MAGTKTNKIDFYGVGVDFAWNPTNTLNGTFYQGKNKITGGASPEATTFIVSNDYAISKRTTIYVQAAFVDSDPGANDHHQPGARQRAVCAATRRPRCSVQASATTSDRASGPSATSGRRVLCPGGRASGPFCLASAQAAP